MARTKYCSLDALQRQTRETLRRCLEYDEQILICCETKSGFLNPHLIVMVITTRRVITVDFSAEIGSRPSFSSLYLADIVSIDEGEGEGLGWLDDFHIRLAAQGEFILCHFSCSADSRKFARILKHAIAEAKSKLQESPKSHSVPLVADQLAKLAKLHQDKSITKEEYEAAKRKLLG